MVNDASSQTQYMNWGLPQGGKLSPLLYLMYVNDIVYYKDTKEGKMILFADDTSITFLIKMWINCITWPI